uniref:Uncharacterized protein n=1 Tax=Octopus bimaculoides TaxID=37653 RepID=A0A0L8H6V3_OCTBM
MNTYIYLHARTHTHTQVLAHFCYILFNPCNTLDILYLILIIIFSLVPTAYLLHSFSIQLVFIYIYLLQSIPTIHHYFFK